MFVVFGVEKKVRDIYLLWEEGKGPDFVLEVSSKKTYRADLSRKKELYAQVLGVKEYFLYDPQHRYLSPPLQGYRLIDGAYVQISPVGDRISSTVLGLELGIKRDRDLGLYNPQTKDWLPSRKERAERAEAELTRLRAELQQRGIQVD